MPQNMSDSQTNIYVFFSRSITNLPLGGLIRLKPQRQRFVELHNPRVILENALRWAAHRQWKK